MEMILICLKLLVVCVGGGEGMGALGWGRRMRGLRMIGMMSGVMKRMRRMRNWTTIDYRREQNQRQTLAL
jgi:hypothetical protein